jgi:predicted transposase YdaD
VAGAFDATLKQLLDACAPDWVAWVAPLCGLPATVGATPLDVDLSTVQPVADKVFRLQAPASGLLHLEAQSSWDGDFPSRLLLYNVLLEDRYGGPVHTAALLLRREASSPGLTGAVVRHDANGREYLRFAYTLVRVWELPADVLLAGGLGATPLALLTDDAAPRMQEVVDRFADRVTRETPTAADADLLLSCGFILTGLRYDKAVARALFHGVQKMRESSTYQAILEEGRDEGIKLGSIRTRQEDLIALLRERFQSVPPEVEAKVRAATDPAKLQAALLRVIHISAPDELPL